METCQHIFTRGDKKGTKCTIKLRGDKAKSAQRCCAHHPNQLEKVNKVSKQRTLDKSTNLYKVTVDNSQDPPVYKKAPREIVVKIMKESRARALEKMGAKVEPLSSDGDYKQLAQTYACLLATHGILDGQSSQEDVLCPPDNIGPPASCV